MKKGIWRNSAGQEVPMATLTDEELKEAFLLVCNREFATFMQINQLHDKVDLFCALKEQLSELAIERNCPLAYPDQVPGKKNPILKHYFEAERRTNAKVAEPVKAVISADTKIES